MVLLVREDGTPGMSWAMVLMAASLATYPELKRKAASF
jgi:hypothetical protein